MRQGLSIEIHQHFGTESRFRQLYRDRCPRAGSSARSSSLLCGRARHRRDRYHAARGLRGDELLSRVGRAAGRDRPRDRRAREIGPRTTVLQVLRHRSRGTVDEAMRERMRLLAPHIQRSGIVGRRIRARSHTVDDLADVLDGLSTAICLLDADGRVVHANAACRQRVRRCKPARDGRRPDRGP